MTLAFEGEVLRSAFLGSVEDGDDLSGLLRCLWSDNA